eukprot:TRINITY_DN48185_c0_g1_i1.p1 TRINITY_DN48185_c0_g1~~TRINITY_DN48185_c0_g1_i1.p1  ORF type:complete len:155 (+),score=16.42 TRINITY_DN48185_c0_g1_i1:71-466(+)
MASKPGKAPASSGPPLQNERYKMCRILCERRNGWTLQSFCRGNYSAVCTQQWRLGHQLNRCVSPQLEWNEKVIADSGCCIDSTVKTRGRTGIPEADAPTRDFCAKRCEDVLDKEAEWNPAEVWELCRHHMT